MKTKTREIYTVTPDNIHFESWDDAYAHVQAHLSQYTCDFIERVRDEFGERCQPNEDVDTWEYINFETLNVTSIKKAVLYLKS